MEGFGATSWNAGRSFRSLPGEGGSLPLLWRRLRSSVFLHFPRFPFDSLIPVETREMAQLLPPMCTDALKLRSCSASFVGTRRCFSRSAVDRPVSVGRNKKLTISAAAGSFGSVESETADDYYSVLGVMPDATAEEIKKAYYNCMKACHPDLSGNDSDMNEFCMFINEVYEILSDPVQRMVYDEIHGYALTSVNPFLDNTKPKDHTFVDEFSCIGCKNCANLVPDVFKIEEDFGRARVCSQSGNPQLVQQAIDSCPVDCIHWTSAAQLSLLEDEMRRVERVNVALRLSGMGASFDVFTMARSRWEKRQMKVLEKARIRMMRKKSSESKKPESYWSNLWENPTTNFKDSEEEVQERSKRAAAAARRWREYSRKGADRRPTFKLPDASLSEKE